jgi:hypothetical protein
LRVLSLEFDLSKSAGSIGGRGPKAARNLDLPLAEVVSGALGVGIVSGASSIGASSIGASSVGVSSVGVSSVGVSSVGVLSVGVSSVSVLSAGVLSVGVLTVGVLSVSALNAGIVSDTLDVEVASGVLDVEVVAGALDVELVSVSESKSTTLNLNPGTNPNSNMMFIKNAMTNVKVNLVITCFRNNPKFEI